MIRLSACRDVGTLQRLMLHFSSFEVDQLLCCNSEVVLLISGEPSRLEEEG
jgi:hypothetical protein